MGRAHLPAAIVALLGLTTPAWAGGGGAVEILETRGSVLVRPVHYKTGQPTGPWRRARPGGLEGTYQLRTGRGSWAHISLPFGVPEGAGKWRYVPAGCVDARSLVQIDSYADSGIRVLRGKISPVDGKRAGRLPDRMGEGS